ncbi:transposon Tf2-9 polyprotein [Trichonephila clavipes]|nr:transposon Tf2-9 polyprotein [Trichonephila clavipes]
MKAIARSFVYWKNIDNDIEEATKNCVDCARYKADPPKSKVHYWEYPRSIPYEGNYNQEKPSNVFEIVLQDSDYLEVREKTTHNIQHAETAEKIFLRIEQGIVFIFRTRRVPSTDVAVPDLSQSSAKEETDRDEESTSSRQAIT